MSGGERGVATRENEKENKSGQEEPRVDRREPRKEAKRSESQRKGEGRSRERMGQVRRKPAPRSSDRRADKHSCRDRQDYLGRPTKIRHVRVSSRDSSVNNEISKNDSWRELTWLGLTATRISVMYRRKLERGLEWWSERWSGWWSEWLQISWLAQGWSARDNRC